MINDKLLLIDEQTSPLQRIMGIYNVHEPAKRSFENNICAFHVGNGYFLSVAHNLRLQAGFYKSITEEIYNKEILPKLDGAQKTFLDQCYFTDLYTRKKYLNTHNHEHLEHITQILKQKRFDTRWVTLAEKQICVPHIIFQFKENLFYKNLTLTKYWNEHTHFFDNEAYKYTFLLETELVYANYSADIALYKLKDTSSEIINQIPKVDIVYDLIDDTSDHIYCLQSSPNAQIGRLINESKIEGLLDHFCIFHDEIAGNYRMEGYRYLIKGYFRFGSSGAPYLLYNALLKQFFANAIQSEASGIQLSIKNDRTGNFQYVNAIASPLNIIKNDLEKILNSGISGGISL